LGLTLEKYYKQLKMNFTKELVAV